MNEQLGLTNESPDAQPASAQLQAQFDMLLGRSRQLMGVAAKEWLATLQKSPVDGAVALGTATLRKMVMMSEQAGQTVDATVLIHVGIQLVKDAAAVANAAGLVPDEQLPDYLQQVMQQSMAEYLRMDAEDGLLTPEDKQIGQNVVDRAGQPPTAGPAQPQSPAQPAQSGMLAQLQGGAA